MLRWFWRRFPGVMTGLSLLASGLRYEPDHSGQHEVAAGPPPPRGEAPPGGAEDPP